MPDAELQLLKLDMEYTKKAVAALDKKVDAGFSAATTQVVELRSEFKEWSEKQEGLFLQTIENSEQQLKDLIEIFEKKLDSKADKDTQWAEPALKWFIMAIGGLMVAYAFKVIFTTPGIQQLVK